MNFKVIDNNKEIECDVLFAFKDEVNDINYIVYTDGTLDEDGQLCVLSSRYILENKDIILKPIENDYEWNLIDNMIASYWKEDEKL